MKIQQRKSLLIAVAAKKPEKLSGKHSRKSIEKFLGATKKTYADLKSKLQAAETQLSGLTSLVEEYKEGVYEARDAILACYEMLKKMDMVGATDVKVKDNQDLAYLSDGRWVRAGEDGSSESYAQYKKRQKEDANNEEPEENDTEEPEDEENKEEDTNNLDEGFEVTL